MQDIDNSISELGHSHIVEVLLYGRKFLDISSNTNILNATIFFFLKTKDLTKDYFKVKTTGAMTSYIVSFNFNFFL